MTTGEHLHRFFGRRPRADAEAQPVSRPATGGRSNSFPWGVSVDEKEVHAVLVRGDGSIVRTSASHKGDHATALRQAIQESGESERRAVFGISVGSAIVDSKRFPVLLSASECASNVSSTVGAKKFAASADNLAVVLSLEKSSKHTSSRLGTYGIVTGSALASVKTIAAGAGLKLTAVDFEAFAWKRALGPQTDAILSLSSEAATFVIFTDGLFVCDTYSRKDAGWGDAVRQKIETVRIESEGKVDPRTIVLFGDGAKSPAINAIAIGARVSFVAWTVTDPTTGRDVPSPDWALAYGLALYEDGARAVFA